MRGGDNIAPAETCRLSSFVRPHSLTLVTLLPSCFDSFVYKCRRYACGEAIVDIDDGNACGTAIEHSQKGGNTAKACACADTGGNGNYGTAYQTSYDAGQSPFHSCYNDDDIGVLELLYMSEQSVQTGNTNITNQLCTLAHNLSGNLCFRCDGQISSAGGNYRDNGLRRFDFFLLQHNRLCRLLISDIRKFFCFDQCLENILLCPSGEDIIAFFSEVREDFSYLFGGFAGAVDDFREAAANLAVMVHVGKAQILERQMAQPLDSLVNADVPALNLFQ